MIKPGGRLTKIERHFEHQSGIVLVEAVLTLTVLIFISMGIFAFTLYLRENEAMTEAIAAGALAATSTPPGTDPNTTSARIVNTVAEFLRRSGRDVNNFIISVSPLSVVVTGTGYPNTTAESARIKITMRNLPLEVPGLTTNHQVCLSTTASLATGTTAAARSDGGADECID